MCGGSGRLTSHLSGAWRAQQRRTDPPSGMASSWYTGRSSCKRRQKSHLSPRNGEGQLGRLLTHSLAIGREHLRAQDPAAPAKEQRVVLGGITDSRIL